MIARVLFKRHEIDPGYVGQMIRSDLPVVLCGACGKGVSLAVVNQQCSAACGAYLYEVLFENGDSTVSTGEGAAYLSAIREWPRELP